ncbi:hypothetical protein MNEG_16562, partial [Monoraphidium neglectum]
AEALRRQRTHVGAHSSPLRRSPRRAAAPAPRARVRRARRRQRGPRGGAAAQGRVQRTGAPRGRRPVAGPGGARGGVHPGRRLLQRRVGAGDPEFGSSGGRRRGRGTHSAAPGGAPSPVN